MECIAILIALCIVMLFGTSTSGDYWFDHWSGKWIVLLGAVSLMLSYGLARRAHWTVGAFFFMLMVGALKSFGWTLIDRDSAYTAFSLMAFAYFFHGLKREHTETLRIFFMIVCASSALYTIGQFNFEPYYRAAFSGNASMNGCLIAVTLPIGLHWLHQRKDDPSQAGVLVLALIAGIAIFMTNTSIPIGVLAVSVIAYFASLTRDKWKTFAVAAMTVGVIAWFAFLTGHKSFLSTSGRTYFWKRIISWWWDSGKIWTGVGTGSGKIIFDWSGQIENMRSGRWLSDSVKWAHNDFLQVLFENGIIGLVLALLVFAFAARAAFNRPWLFASVIGYGATACLNYPAHLPVHAFLGASLLWMAHRGADEARV